MPIALEIKNLTLKQGRRTLIEHFSADILAGELIGIFGANGAGKTTFLKSLAQLHPLPGSVNIFNVPLAKSPRSVIGYMPQIIATPYFGNVCVLEHVAMVLNGKSLGIPHLGIEAKKKALDLLASVGALSLQNKNINELSGGERRRVALAEALMNDPKILLLDEPLANLDPHYRLQFIELLLKLKAERHITILLSAHILNTLVNALTRVMYIGKDGASLHDKKEALNETYLNRLYGAPVKVIVENGQHYIMQALDARHEIDEAG